MPHICLTYVPILIILQLLVTEYELQNLIAYTLAVTLTAHAQYHVTYAKEPPRLSQYIHDK